MNKIIFVMVLFGLLMLFGCGQSEAEPTSVPPVAEPTSVQQDKYRVTNSTNLYDSASIDAGVIEELSVGTILEKAGESLDCVKFEDGGMTFELCQMRNTATGSTGWVLYKWLELVQP